jgi:hypothetical protein
MASRISRVSHWPRLAGLIGKTVRSYQTNYLSFLRNVIYICHLKHYSTETGDYRRILAISIASSSENTGTALLL